MSVYKIYFEVAISLYQYPCHWTLLWYKTFWGSYVSYVSGHLLWYKAKSLNISKNEACCNTYSCPLFLATLNRSIHVVAMTILEHTHDQGHHQLYHMPSSFSAQHYCLGSFSWYSCVFLLLYTLTCSHSHVHTHTHMHTHTHTCRSTLITEDGL